MLSTRSIRVVIAVLFATLLLAAVQAIAKDGRDFAGFYSLAGVAEQGDAVRVTLELQLFNYSGADLKDAVIAVRQSPGLPDLGSFAPIPHWRSGHDVAVSRQFTVPRREFEQWSTHGQPDVVVTHTDSDGQTWRGTAQLTQRPEALSGAL